MRRNQSHMGLVPGPAPLMTDHLHSLDLELELLKRKRQILEQQQQQIMGNKRQRSFDNYNEPIQPWAQSGSSHNFANFYDEQPDPRSNFGKNRQGIPVWENEIPAKRFGDRFNQPRSAHERLGPVVSRNNKRGNFRRRPPINSEPHVKPVAGRPFQNPQPRPRKDFNPSKVTKNRVTVTTRPERVVSVAGTSVQGTVSKPLILQADSQDRRVEGRLELAVGHLVKEIRGRFGPDPQYAEVMSDTRYQRVLKQTIRDRVRSVMLGKTVGSHHNTIQVYRAQFPTKTDVDFLNNSITKYKDQYFLDHEPVEPEELEEDPYEYFKTNFTTLLSNKLEEMFEKIKEVYQTEYGIIANTSLASEKVDESLTETKDTDDSVTEASDSMAETKTLNESSKANDVNEESEVMTDSTEPVKVENPEVTDSQPKVEETKVNNEAAVVDENKDVDKIKPVHINHRMAITLTNWLKRKLPYVLPRYKECIIRLLDMDQVYKTTEAAIIMQTTEKAKKFVEREEKIAAAKAARAVAVAESGKADKQKTTTDPSKKNASRHMLPYYVKVFGRPHLPKRKQMQAFLDQFNPMIIKRHKNVFNLLFIGFKDKDDFERILKADETIIGRCSLSIKVSNKSDDKGNQDADTEQTEAGQQNGETKQGNASENIDFSEDLDTQIVKTNDETVPEAVAEAEIKVSDKEAEPQENSENPTEEPEAIESNENPNKEPKAMETSENKTGEVNAEKKEEMETTKNPTLEVIAEEPKEMETGPVEDEAKTDAPNISEEVKPPISDVETLKNVKQAPATPTRASTRLANAGNATPSSIKTRRASKLQ